MFPNMVTPDVSNALEPYKQQVLGWKISGAGGGGYLIFINDKPVKNAIQIRIRRHHTGL
jgi:galactokinase/mevalonate kinase-like predicted kinase